MEMVIKLTQVQAHVQVVALALATSLSIPTRTSTSTSRLPPPPHPWASSPFTPAPSKVDSDYKGFVGTILNEKDAEILALKNTIRNMNE